MPKQQKRNNSYYGRQLMLRFPTIHSDFLAGKYSSLRDALIAAGIRKPRSRLHELKNAWNKASKAEQREFARWLRAQIGATAIPSVLAGGSLARPIAVDRRLETWAASRIEIIMTKRGMRMGNVMHEMGFNRLDASLGRALARGGRLQPDVLTALEIWLRANEKI
ncbi:hypothetical protein [Nitratireductor indicus]|uniref:hypothetical protein n=1 Tax=Nitratireductor indicus TaxID=721133 RepID=UPI0028745D59|nr:hypothetical protein [Nitratireductor indicus]MDS1136718.1 hypothetical protein [Nitratireductor indicus]